MRALFLFLWRFKYFILFLLIEGFCFFLIFQNRNFHRTAFINSTNTIAVSVNESVTTFKEYLNLKKVNSDLSDENSQLRSQLQDAFYVDTAEKKTVNDTIYHQQYSFLTAKVINNSANRRNNYLTLNKGSLQDVKPEMGVICSEGIVGIVKDVSEHFCSVLSFLHKDARMSAKIKKSEYIGSLIWDGYDATEATLKDIAIHVKLEKGDTIVTSSFSAIFPEGIMMGTIEDFKTKEGDNFYDITVHLSTDFSKLSYVYIVNNVLKEEQRQLEKLQDAH
jgi:rod shape-determining protein MreC